MATVTDTANEWDVLADSILGPPQPVKPPPAAAKPVAPQFDWDAVADQILGPAQPPQAVQPAPPPVPVAQPSQPPPAQNMGEWASQQMRQIDQRAQLPPTKLGLPPEQQTAQPQAQVTFESPWKEGVKAFGRTLGRGVVRGAQDTAVTAGKAAVSLPQSVVGLADIPTFGLAGWLVEKTGVRFKEAQDILHGLYSEETQRAYQQVAGAEGIGGKALAAIKNPSTIVTQGVESVPSMLAGGAIGKAAAGIKSLPKLAKYAGAIGEAAISAGQGAEQVRAEGKSGFLTPKQVAIQAASGALTGVIGVLGSGASKWLGIDDVDSLLSGQVSESAKRGVLMRVFGGMVSEGLIEELPQSIQEQVAQNISLGNPWLQGVEQSAAMGALVGGLMGAGANLVKSASPASREEQPPAKPGPTLDEIIAKEVPDADVQASRDAERLSALPGKLAAGETASRGDAFAWERMFPDQPKLPTERVARTEELNRRIKEMEDAEAVRITEAQAGGVQGGEGVRGTGKEQGPTEPPSQGPEAQVAPGEAAPSEAATILDQFGEIEFGAQAQAEPAEATPPESKGFTEELKPAPPADTLSQLPQPPPAPGTEAAPAAPIQGVKQTAPPAAPEPPAAPDPFRARVEATVASVPLWKGATVETDADARTARITLPGGRVTTVHFDADADVDRIAGELGKKGKGAFTWTEGADGLETHIWLRTGTSVNTLNHEAMHGLQKFGIVTPEEVEAHGGFDAMARAYGEWVEGGRKGDNGVFARIWDFFQRLLGSAEALQRKTFKDIEGRVAPAEQTKPAAPPMRDMPPLAGMTRDQLFKEAKRWGVKASGLSNATLIQKITDKRVAYQNRYTAKYGPPKGSGKKAPMDVFSDILEGKTGEETPPAAEAPAEAPAAKEPWQMTRDEYGDYYRANYKSEQARVGNFPNLAHKNEVRMAVEKGKPVPAEVLADYPDLQPKAEPAATATPKVWGEEEAKVYEQAISDTHKLLIDSDAFAKSDFYDRAHPIPRVGGIIAARKSAEYANNPEYQKWVDDRISDITKYMVDLNRKRLILRGVDVSGDFGVSYSIQPEKRTAKYTVDVVRAWNMEAKSKYPYTNYLGDVAVREGLQNSLDAVLAKLETKKGRKGTIDFTVTDSGFTIRDNGIGMSEDDIAEKFLALHATGKDVQGRFGGFGIAKAVILGPSDTSTWVLKTRDNLFTHELAQGEQPIQSLPERMDGTEISVRDTTNRQLTSDQAKKYVETTEVPANIKITYNGQPVTQVFARRKPHVESVKLGDGGQGSGDMDVAYYPKAPKGYDKTLVLRLVDTKTGSKLTQGIMPIYNDGFSGTLVADVTTTATPGSYEYPLTDSRMELKWGGKRLIDTIVEKHSVDPMSAQRAGLKSRTVPITSHSAWNGIPDKAAKDAGYQAVLQAINDIFTETVNFFGQHSRPITPLDELKVKIDKGFKGYAGGSLFHAKHLAAYEAVARLFSSKVGAPVNDFYALLSKTVSGSRVESEYGGGGLGLNHLTVSKEAVKSPLRYAFYLSNLLNHELTHYKHGKHNEEFSSAREATGEKTSELFPYVLRIAEAVVGKPSEITKVVERVTEVERVKEVPVEVEVTRTVDRIVRDILPTKQLELFKDQQRESADGQIELFFPEVPGSQSQLRLFGPRGSSGVRDIAGTERLPRVGRGDELADLQSNDEAGTGRVGPVQGVRGESTGAESAGPATPGAGNVGPGSEEAPPPAESKPTLSEKAAKEEGADTGEDFGKRPSEGVGIAATVPLSPSRGGIGRSIGRFFQRFFTTRGELPADVYDAKVRKEGRVAKEMNTLRFTATDFRRGIRKALGGRELTQADVEHMNAVLRGESDLSTVPEQVRAPLQAMRDHIDALSRALIAEGVAQGDLVGIIDENLGVYATRSYRVFTDPKWRDTVPDGVRNRAVAEIREMYPEKSDDEVAGILESLLFRGAADSPVALLKGSKLGSKDLSVFMRRKDVPEWLRDLWGEYKDAGVNYARSVFKISHLLANQQFLNEVRDAGLGKWLRTKEDGPIVSEYGEVITPIAAEGSSVMAPLNGLYTTPEIKAAFERFDSPGSMPDWIRVLISVNYTVKYGKTVGSVMTHIRNVISNLGFALANGHWRLDKASKAIWATATGLFQLPDADFRTYYERLAELGLVGEDVRAGELKDALRDASKANIDEFLYNREERHAKKIVKAGRAGVRFIEGLYHAEDAVWKIYAWENEKARYAKAHPEWSEDQVERHAAEIVRDTYPTYSKIPEGIKAIRRFPLVGPFVSFPSEVVRTTFNTIRIGIEEMQSPETRAIGAQRLVGTTIALGGLSVLSRGMMAMFGIGGDEDEDLRWFVPPWQENSRFVYTSKPENATYRFVDLGYSDPHAYLTDAAVAFMRGGDWKESLWKATSEFMRPFASEEILAKALMDLRSNEDNKIYNPMDTAGNQAKDMIGHLWSKALEPGTISSLRRIREAATGENPNRETKTEVLAITTGQRFQSIDVEHSLGFRVRDFAKDLVTIQDIARKTATSRGTATGEMVATDLARMEKLRLAKFAEMQRIVGAARRLGVPESNIQTILNNGLSYETAKQVMTGDYSPYEMSPQTAHRMMKARPEEFTKRFAGWHGDNTAGELKKYKMSIVAGVTPEPKQPEKEKYHTDAAYQKAVEEYPQKVAEHKEARERLEEMRKTLNLTHEQAQQLLVESLRKSDSKGKTQTERSPKYPFGFDESYMAKAAELAKLYGEKDPEAAAARFQETAAFQKWDAEWRAERERKVAPRLKELQPAQ